MGDREPQQSLHRERWELLTRRGGSTQVPRLRLGWRHLDTAPTQEPRRAEAPAAPQPYKHPGNLPLPPTLGRDLRAMLKWMAGAGIQPHAPFSRSFPDPRTSPHKFPQTPHLFLPFPALVTTVWGWTVSPGRAEGRRPSLASARGLARASEVPGASFSE